MKKIINNIDQSLRRVALYLRLSKEDLDKESPDSKSESIKNQELMLKNYAKEQQWEIVGIYDDEDFSGSDQDRPNFNKMLKECEKGNIDIVLVKTQSRFARDVELIEKYVHGKFNEWGVRFVTYIEHIDNTKIETKKTSQITALTDQWTLEDISANLRSTIRNKKSEGLFVGAFAPYGYMKSPDDRNQLIIDPIASEVVKTIFELYSKGFGYYKIISYLIENKIPSPYDYKRKNGIKLNLPSRNKYLDSISKKGNYIITNQIENKENKGIKNIVSIGMLTNDKKLGKKLPQNITLSVRKIDSGIKLFYSTILQNHIDIDKLLESDNWKELKVDDVIPNDTLYIAGIIPEIKRLGKLKYELEANINFNNKYPDYYYFNNTYVDNDVNIKNSTIYENKSCWSINTIRCILTNEIYIGNLVQGKYSSLSYKNNKTITLPRDKWIKNVNTHEPIIEKDLWYAVQERFNNRVRIDTKTGFVNVFSKKVYCDYCGKRLEKNSNKKGGYLLCSDNRNKWINCDNKKSIRYDFLEKYIIDEINKFLAKYKDDEILNNLNQDMIDKNLFESKIKSLKKEYSNNEKEMKNKNNYFECLYEDRVNKLITIDQYIFLSKKYTIEIEELNERQNKINQELEILYNKQSKLKNIKELLNKYKKIDKLTTDIMNEWIDKIYIGIKSNSNIPERDIKIVWNF